MFKKGIDDEKFLNEVALVVARTTAPNPGAWMEMRVRMETR